MDEIMEERARGRKEEKLQLVKIDVEGFEAHVIRGMRNTIRRYQPALVVEVNPEGPYRELQELMMEHNYEAYHIQDSGPIPTEAVIPDILQRFRNYMFIPKL